MDITIITALVILTGTTIYFYWQNQILMNDINKEKQVDNQKESFVATLVHDLKTPTNAQLNILNLLKKETFGTLNSRQQEIISLSQESCKYMYNLICTIMDTYKFDYGEITLKKSEFDIQKLIAALCNETKIFREEKNQVLELVYSLDTPIVYADELQIERVISNLMSNAINYGFHNSSIGIYVKNSENSFEMCIKNKSCPIPKKELSNLFEKYKQTKLSKYNNIGTGLGLYLSRKIVNLHGGKVYANSEPDGICTFGFIIPTYHKTSNLKKQYKVNKSV